MSSPTSIDLVHKAIAAGINGYISWKDSAYELVRDGPESLAGLTPEALRSLLCNFVREGNRLSKRKETRKEWLEANSDRPDHYRDHWYRAIIPMPALFSKGLFVEVRLFDDDPAEPWVEIVSAHPQK